MPTIQLDGLKPIANFNRATVTAAFPNGAKIGSLPCGKLITIACLRQLYNFPASNTSAAGNEMGIGEWADYLYEADLPTFFQNFTSPQIPATVKPEFISIDGGLTANLTTVSQFSGVESALDFQSAYSIIYPQNLRLYQVGDGINVDSVGTFNIFLDALDASYCTYEGGDQPYVGKFTPVYIEAQRRLTVYRSCLPRSERQSAGLSRSIAMRWGPNIQCLFRQLRPDRSELMILCRDEIFANLHKGCFTLLLPDSPVPGVDETRPPGCECHFCKWRLWGRQSLQCWISQFLLECRPVVC